MFSRKTKKSKRNGVIAPLVVGLLGVSCFALWHALSIPSFAADPEETTEGIVVTGVSNVTEYLTSLVLYTDDPMSKTAVVLKYDADLNALIIDGAVNADALAIGSGNQIHGSGNVTLGGEKNIISNSNSNYSAIVGGKGNIINGSKSGTRSLTGSVIVGGEKNTLKNVNPNSLIIGGYLNTGDAGEYQVFLGGTGSKNTSSAKYFLVLGEGGNTVSSNSILMGGNIQGAKDGSHTYSSIFVWSDTGTFTPNYSKAFYANTSEGFGLNTSSPKLKLDLSKSGVLYIKKSGQINTNSQALGLECSKNKPDVKGTIAYIENGNNVGLCGCNGETWVPLSIDSFTQYACAKAGSAGTTNCLGSLTHVVKKASNGKLRWYSDGNNGSGEWKYPNWTYGGVESGIGGDRECVYTCEVGYAPRTGDTSINWNPVGWFTGSCVQCTEIANRDKWRTAGSGVDDCGFSCKAGYKYDQQARTCTICSIGEWTKADNQSGSCSRCEMPKGNAYVSSNSGTGGILKDGTPYFGNFVSIGTGGNKNSCKFTCLSGFYVSYQNNSNNACVQCGLGQWSDGGSVTSCSSCTNKPSGISFKWKNYQDDTSWNQGNLSQSDVFQYTSIGYDGPTSCEWKCRADRGLIREGDACVCADKNNTHLEVAGEHTLCVSNVKNWPCGAPSEGVPDATTITGQSFVPNVSGNGTWTGWQWNGVKWQYIDYDDFLSNGSVLGACEWTCPKDYKRSGNTCIAPKPGECSSLDQTYVTGTPTNLCKSTFGVGQSPVYHVSDLTFKQSDGTYKGPENTLEAKGWYIRTCKGERDYLDVTCMAYVKGTKESGICKTGEGEPACELKNGLHEPVLTGYTYYGDGRTRNIGTDATSNKRLKWQCPGFYGGDFVHCGICDTNYTFSAKGDQRCYANSRISDCETGEKPSSWGSAGYIYGTGKYTQTLNTEETTFKYEPIKKWEYTSGSVTQNGGGDHTCKFTCDKGYHKYGTTTKTCVQCLKSTSTVQGTYAANIGSDSCTAAEDGYYTDAYAATSQKVCPAGYYCPGGKIIDCPAGSYCPQGSVEPIKCGDGKYSSKNSKASSDCKSISCGYYGSSESSSQPSGKKCSAGTYSAQGSKECSNCSAGTYSSAGACSCTSCVASSSTVAGTYSSSAGSSSCTKASDGYYVKEAGATQQTICPAGYYCKGGKINDCPCGSYCTQGSSEPTECGAGKYSSANSTSSSACKNISAGYYGTSACSSTPNTCAAGKYSKAGYSTCYNCIPGTYSSAGASSCTKCSAGTYSSSYGSTSCTNCGGGKWSAEGSSSCSNISCGYYGSSESSSKPSGKKCSAGTYSSTGSASCTNCAPNYYTANAGSCSCTKCPDGQTSSAGSSSCIEEKCPTGYQDEYTLQSADDCGDGTAKSNGWKLEQNGTANGHACVKCVEKPCPDGMSTTCDGNRHDSDYSGDKECHKCDVYEYYSTGAPFLCYDYKEGDAEADKACQQSAGTYDGGGWTCYFADMCPGGGTVCECSRIKRD